MTSPHRERAVQSFSARLELPPIRRLIQRGRDPELARYTLELADGQLIPIGPIGTLWSQAEFFKVLAVSIGSVPYSIEQKEWRQAIRVLIRLGTDVIETPGETFEDTVSEWVERYGARATTDKAGASSGGMPFIAEDRLHVSVNDLARYIRREYAEQVRLTDLRRALGELGYERVTSYYDVRDGSKVKRSSTSYYRAPAKGT